MPRPSTTPPECSSEELPRAVFTSVASIKSRNGIIPIASGDEKTPGLEIHTWAKAVNPRDSRKMYYVLRMVHVLAKSQKLSGDSVI